MPLLLPSANRLFAFSLVFATGLLASSRASAQLGVETVFVPGTRARFDASGQPLVRPYLPPFENVLTLDDCLEDTAISFPVKNLGDCADCVEESWAGPEGADCTDVNRRSDSTALCWQVAPSRPFVAGDTDVRFRVQDLFAGLSSLPPTGGYSPATGAVCNVGSSAGSRVELMKLVRNGDQNAAYTTTHLPLHLTQPGVASFTAASAEAAWFELEVGHPEGSPLIRGYVAYCIPPEDVGVTAACGADKRGASTPLASPADRSPFECGRLVDTGGGKMVITPPAPGVPFVVAVAAFDEVGLVGPALAWNCSLETPSPLKGSCALTPRDRLGESKEWLWGVALAALLALGRRRRVR